MKVSVIIPCYNSGEHIVEAVDSVFAQTYPQWEIIIVDDGSTDASTLKTLDELTVRPRITVLHQNNAGPANARNTGIGAAEGEYILPLDADDTIAPVYMEKAITLLDADSNLGIVYCKAEKFGLQTGSWDLPIFSFDIMVVNNVIFCTAFFRKKDWQTVAGYPEYARFGLEDYGFWLRILRLGRTVHRIEETLFRYRISAESRTTHFENNDERKVATYAAIFRDNVDYFINNAEAMYRIRLQMEKDMVTNALAGNGPMPVLSSNLLKVLISESYLALTLENKLVEAQERIADLERKYWQVSQEFGELQPLRGELALKETLLREMLASRSWAVTKPLRGVAAIMRRLYHSGGTA